jgi:hypothetical protein
VEPYIGWILLGFSAVLWAVVVALGIRARRDRVSVRTRDVSGVVVVGNVKGGVRQHQATGSGSRSGDSPGAARRAGRRVVWLLALVASILTTVGFILQFVVGV